MHEVSDLTHASKVVHKVCDELAGVLDDHLAGKRTKFGPGKEMKRESVPNSGWAVKTWEKVDDFIERFVNSVLSDTGNA